MFKTISFAMRMFAVFGLAACLIGLSWGGDGTKPDVKVLLKEADAYRITGDQMRVETEIQLYKSGELDKSRRYTVFLKPGRRSLVLFRSKAERGQKLLMLDDKFWTIMPNSRRPIRITPSQKLLGEASSGDIATLTWSEDYTATLVGESEIDSVPCWHLDLQAARRGVTYTRIDLYVAKDDRRPVKAGLYVASGKLAKIAYFEMGKLNGNHQVVTMRLQDKIQQKRVTLVRYLDMAPQATPDKLYNPAYLVRNDLANW